MENKNYSIHIIIGAFLSILFMFSNYLLGISTWVESKKNRYTYLCNNDYSIIFSSFLPILSMYQVYCIYK